MCMLNEEQKKLRRSGLGGSDISTLLGLNPYSNRLQLYLEKVEGLEIDLSDNEAIVWGNLLEEAIANRYSEVTGKEVYSSKTAFHPKYHYFLANPDGLIRNEKRGLEIKNVGIRSSHLWGESGSQIIPEYYYTQVMHYLFVMDYDYWDVAVLIGGQELRIYTFERDREFDQIIINAGTQFWKEHVEPKVPPDADWNAPNSKSILKNLYGKSDGEEIDLGDELVKWRDVWLEAKEILKKYHQVSDGAQSHILASMRNSTLGKFSDGSSFVRKVVKVKEYTVAASEYINFSFKKGSTNE